ncbi:MAG TPA: alkaline phosphatase family protein [Candidatus Sulfotelmatobacter sp.]|nr:alkaline phosphatase family protein [Candidatus Sulfotelmatobacter sp.]
MAVAIIVVGFALFAPSGPPTPSATATSEASATATTGATASLGGSPSASSTAATTRVWWIVMENHEYGSIIGSKSAPYFNSLAAKYALLTAYYATTHPSEPNYIAMVAGSTLGVTSDGTYNLTGDSLFSELAAAGLPWRAYEQDIPPGCFTGDSAKAEPDGPGADGAYARKHDPAMSFTSVSGDVGQCANVQPLSNFFPAAAAFAFITPNLINDMHDGTVAQGDAFLRDFVPLITDSAAFANGVLFITFDEGSSNAGSHGDGGGHIPTLIIAAGIKAGTRIATYADHYSLLRTTQALFGLPCLAHSCERLPIAY